MKSDRRNFLKQSVATGVAVSAGLTGCQIPPPPGPAPSPAPGPSPAPTPSPTPTPSPAPGPSPTPSPAPGNNDVISGAGGVRQSATSMGSNHAIMVAYREAVRRMKALPASDPRSWRQQAAIHANSCPHGNWFFLPWHRAYLYYFEDICRTLIGDSGFALPYWDWGADARLPVAVTGGPSNPLWNARSLPAGTPVNSATVRPATLNSMLGTPNFNVFGGMPATRQRQQTTAGTLESQPHNTVHSVVGGDMGRVPNAALDSVFWLHHSGADYYWARWTNAGNSNPTDAAFRNFVFRQNFVDGQGRAVDISVAETYDLHQTRYRYSRLNVAAADSEPSQQASQMRLRDAAAGLRIAARAEVPGHLTASTKNQVRLKPVTSAKTVRVANLRLEGVSVPKNPEVEVHISRMGEEQPLATLGLFVGKGIHDHTHGAGMGYRVALSEPVELPTDGTLELSLSAFSAKGRDQHISIKELIVEV